MFRFIRNMFRHRKYSEPVACEPVRLDDFDEDGIRFELIPATGGRILRVRRTTRSTNAYKDIEHNQQVYVIPSGEDVGQRVAKILNLELLK